MGPALENLPLSNVNEFLFRPPVELGAQLNFG